MRTPIDLLNVTARRSRFDKDWKQVQDPATVLRTARRRLGRPTLQRWPDCRVYIFPHNTFDELAIRVPRRD